MRRYAVGSWGWILAVIIAVFIINFVLPSDLNGWTTTLNLSPTAIFDDHYLKEEANWRLTNSEFGRRPLVVNLLLTGVRLTGWSYIIVFALLQFVGYLLCCGALVGWCRSIHPRASLFGILLPFVLLFPQVFLFVAHAHTFDDFYQYTALLLGLLASSRKQHIAAWLLLVGACVIRETSLLLVPTFAALLYVVSGWRMGRIILFSITAVACSAFVLWLYLPDAQQLATVEFTRERRFGAWRENFQSWRHVSETLMLPVLILGPSLVLLLTHWGGCTARRIDKCLSYCFLFTVVVNTGLVWLAAAAAEARLFMLPLLCIFPVLSRQWTRLIPEMVDTVRNWKLKEILAATVIILFIQALYHPTVGGTGYAFRLYVAVWTVGMICVVQLTYRRSLLFNQNAATDHLL